MSIDHLYLALFAVISGVSLAGLAILADGPLPSRPRQVMAALGCCVILVGVLVF